MRPAVVIAVEARSAPTADPAPGAITLGPPLRRFRREEAP